LERIVQEWGSVDPLLAILGGLLKDPKKYQDEIQVFREAVYHIFHGDFRAWRNGEIPSVYARAIDYLKGEKLFWDPWNTGEITEIPRLEAGPSKKIYEQVQIFDSDDPNWILRRGELSDQLKNCFQVHGNPERVRALVTDLASKSRRLVVVRVGSRVVSVAIAKIVKGPDGLPLIHLEKPLSEKGGYHFEGEMLNHLHQKKLSQMNPRPGLSKDMAGRSAANKTTVWSIGAATKDEHAEALFGFRPTERLSHPGEVILNTW